MSPRLELRLEVIEDPTAFERLTPEWDDLLTRSRFTSPFLTHEWQWSWWQALGPGRKLFLVAVRDGTGGLVALAPLMISRRFGLRVLEFIGTGLSDYLGFIVAAGSSSVVDSIFSCLLAHHWRWDVVELRVPEESVSLEHIRLVARRYGLRTHHRVYEVAPFLEITGTWEDFVNAKSKKFRYALRERERRFTAHDGTMVQRLEASEIDGSLARALWEVERHSWKVEAGTSPMRRRAVREFYEQFLSSFARRGWVQARIAYLDGAPIAYILNMPYGGRVLLYAISYHKDFASLAPGMLLLQQSIHEAFEQKATEYEFLCGDEPYKWRWATGKRNVLQIVLSRPTPVSFLGSLVAYRFRWWLARSARLRAMKLWLIAAKSRLRPDGDDAR